MRRLRILVLICLLAVLLAPAAQALADEYLVYVGTYTGQGSEGIYAYRFNPATGEAVPLGLAAKTDQPSFLAADPKGRFLYAANELETFGGEPAGAVSVFAIDRASGRLTLLQQIPSGGVEPAYPLPGQDGPVSSWWRTTTSRPSAAAIRPFSRSARTAGSARARRSSRRPDRAWTRCGRRARIIIRSRPPPTTGSS